MRRFLDRAEAGRDLARALSAYSGRRDLAVLALPRGGVPVGYEVARFLESPLDVFVVRKLGVPGQEELAFGAVASGGVRILNDGIVRSAGIDEGAIEAASAAQRRELERLERDLRGGRALFDVRGRTVILVDDGLATGATMLAAVSAARSLGPVRVIAAVPVGSAEACEKVSASADELVCLAAPDPFFAVGAWYFDFTQTTDAEVHELLLRAGRREDVPG